MNVLNHVSVISRPGGIARGGSGFTGELPNRPHGSSALQGAETGQGADKPRPYSGRVSHA